MFEISTKKPQRKIPTSRVLQEIERDEVTTNSGIEIAAPSGSVPVDFSCPAWGWGCAGWLMLCPEAASLPCCCGTVPPSSPSKSRFQGGEGKGFVVVRIPPISSLSFLGKSRSGQTFLGLQSVDKGPVSTCLFANPFYSSEECSALCSEAL